MRIGFDITQEAELMEAAFDEPFLVTLSPEQLLCAEEGTLLCTFETEARELQSISLHLTLPADAAKKVFHAKQGDAASASFSFGQSVQIVFEAASDDFTPLQRAALVQAELPEDLLDILNAEGMPLLFDLRCYQITTCSQQSAES